jgi:hypothetical protein
MHRPPSRILRWLCCIAVGVCLAVPVAARPVVIELFTSQGCSSCPPADALIGELARDPSVLALAFHVDYWDYLGWIDRFALSAAAERQRRYVTALRLASAYTPQMVVDGQTDLVGTDAAALRALLHGPRPGVPIAITLGDALLEIELPAQPSAGGGGDVTLYAYLAEARSPIRRGENAGRTLREFNVVRGSVALGRWAGGARRFTVPVRTLPADATAVAVVLQRPDQGPVLGAASRPLH